MNISTTTDSQFPFSYIDLRPLNSPAYNRSAIKYPSLVQHSPQPSRVRHIKDLLGNPICVVQTEEWKSNNKYQTRFPPNNYEDAKLRKSSNHFSYSCGLNPNTVVTARPNLDTMLSLNYFTGLQNMSFKNRSNFTIKRINKFDGWVNELKDLTDVALEPILKSMGDIKVEKIPEIMENRRGLSGSMKRLYSSSGRIIPTITDRRPITAPGRRPSTRMSSAKSSHSQGDFGEFDFDLQVFYILGGILQTTDNEVIKTWLLTATEREKAIMVDILRGALLNKQELDMFVKDPGENNNNLILYTPNKNLKSKISTIYETKMAETCNSLTVHPDPSPKSEIPQIRPPTSSTFKNTGPASRPPSRQERQEATWIPNDSIVVN